MIGTDPKSGSKNRGRPISASSSGSNAVTCTANMIDQVLEIANKRRRILSELRVAVQAGNRAAVFNLARKLTGLNDETSHRTDPSFN